MKYVNGGNAVACSSEVYEIVKAYAEKESVSMKEALDRIVKEWFSK